MSAYPSPLALLSVYKPPLNALCLFTLPWLLSCAEAVSPSFSTRVDMEPPLSGAEVAGTEVAGAEVSGTEVAGAEVAGTEVAGAEVAGAEVAGAEVAGAEVAGAEVAGAEVAGAEVAGAEVAGVMMGGAEVAGVMMGGAEVAGTEDAGVMMGGEVAGVMMGGAEVMDDMAWLTAPLADDVQRVQRPCPSPQMGMSGEMNVTLQAQLSELLITVGQSRLALLGKTSDQRDLLIYPADVVPVESLRVDQPITINAAADGAPISALAVSQLKSNDRLAIVAQAGSTLKVIYASLSARRWVSYELALGTSAVRELRVSLGSRIHVSALVGGQVKMWRLHPHTGALERSLDLGVQVTNLKVALNGDVFGLLYQERSTWRWCAVSSINYLMCPSNVELPFITETDDERGVQVGEAQIEPRTWLVSLAGGGMLRGVTIDAEGTLLNTGTITLSSPYLAAAPELELEWFAGGGLLGSVIGDNTPLQLFGYSETVFPMSELGAWSLGQNVRLDRSESMLKTEDASQWAVIGGVSVETGRYAVRVAELTCQ